MTFLDDWAAIQKKHLAIRQTLDQKYGRLTKPQSIALANPSDHLLVGHANGRPLRLPWSTRNQHTFLTGLTRTGKTTYVYNLICEAVKAGEGGVVFDPHHRSLIDTLLSSGVFDRRRVHVVSPNARMGFGFNPLQKYFPTDATSAVVRRVMSAMDVAHEGQSFKLFPGLRRVGIVALTVLADQGLSLAELPKLLDVDDAWGLRQYALDNTPDTLLKVELRRIDNLSKNKYRQRDYHMETIAPLNRVFDMLDSHACRAIVGQTENTLDLRRMMDAGDWLLLDLSAGSQVDVDQADMLGRLFLNVLLSAAKARKKTTPFNIVLDEVQRFDTPDLTQALTELAKYGIAVTAATGSINQLAANPMLQQAFLEVQTHIIFRGGNAEDMEKRARSAVPVNLERAVEATVKPTVVGYGRTLLNNHSTNESFGTNRSNTDGWSENESDTYGEAEGESESESETYGTSDTENWSEADSESEGETETESHSDSWNEGSSSGSQMAPNENKFMGMDLNDPETVGLSEQSSSSNGGSDGTRLSKSKSQAKTFTYGKAHTDSYSKGRTLGKNRSRNKSHTDGRGVSGSDTYGESESAGSSRGQSESLMPILEDRPSGVHPLTNEIYNAGQMLMSIPKGHAWVHTFVNDKRIRTLLKVPYKPVQLIDTTSIKVQLIEHDGGLKTEDVIKIIDERVKKAEPRPVPKRKKRNDEGWGKL